MADSTQGVVQIRNWLSNHAQQILGLASVVFIAGFAIPILFPHLPPVLALLCHVAVAVTWLIFVLEYAMGMHRAGARRKYIRRNFVKLLILLLPAFQVLRVLPFLKVLDQRARRSDRVGVMAYTIGGVLILMFFCALLALHAERYAPGATITDFGAALWWAVATMTTVGYGDVTPVTASGRLAGVLLMAGSFVLLATATGTMASWMTDRITNPQADQISALQRENAELRAEVERLRSGE